jgi:hypothetical protein
VGDNTEQIDVVDQHQENIDSLQVKQNDKSERERASSITIDLEVLKDYADNQVDRLKDFITEVTKKLPLPGKASFCVCINIFSAVHCRRQSASKAKATLYLL